jgi:hypothetical protein
VTLPATLTPKTYSVKWKCAPLNPNETPPQIGVVEVLPMMPIVTSATGTSAKAQSAFELKDRVEVEVEGLKTWRDQSAVNAAAPLHLYLVGIELKNLTMAPLGERRDEKTGKQFSTLAVALEVDDKDSATRKAWIQVLQSAMKTPDTKISVGPAAGEPFPTKAEIRLDVFSGFTWLVLTFLLALAGVLVGLGRKSNLLRDMNGAVKPPYSLSRHQMAVWLLVVVGGYLYVGLITGTATAVSSTALILIGISGATGLAAVAIDDNKRKEGISTRASLEAERVSLEKLLNEPVTGLQAQLAAAVPGSAAGTQLAAAIQVKVARLEEIKAALSQPVKAPTESRKWYLDLLSDENGISFHRLQMAVWTVVLAGIFLKTVWTDAMMPEFDATTLGLMGISSGTYLGFKVPEKKS